MDLYIIRHGESVANATKVHGGWAQVPLTEKGEQQAQSISKILSKITFTRVIASDLLRAEQTAKLALPTYDYDTDPRLREINVGILSGRSVSKCKSELGEEYISNVKQFNFVPYSGENAPMHNQRVADFMNDITNEPESSTIAVVCHEGTIVAMLSHVLQASIPRHVAPVMNCGICVLSFLNGQWFLRKWNETGSLISN